MTNLTIKENLITEVSLAGKLKNKIPHQLPFMIPSLDEVYLPDFLGQDKWVVIFQSSDLGVFIYSNFAELMDDLIERDVQPEEIVVLRDDQIEINVNVGK